jgi:hypothetical protein
MQNTNTATSGQTGPDLNKELILIALDALFDSDRVQEFAECRDFVIQAYGEQAFQDWKGHRKKKQAEENSEPVSDDGSKLISIGELLAFNRHQDPDNMIGNRWLCKGGSLVIQGPTGVGKSSLLMQLAITFALGKPLFRDLRPLRPFKFLIIQAENDKGDLAEPFQDITSEMQSKGFMESGDMEKLKQNLIFYGQASARGEAFVEFARKKIEEHQPDIVIADPLLSYVGGNFLQQETASNFLRGWLNPLLQKTGVLWIWIHHTGKPPSDRKGNEQSREDKKYSGLNSSELNNWAREIATLTDLGDENYELDFGKRWKRTGFVDEAGSAVCSVSLKHGKENIVWHRSPGKVTKGDVKDENGKKLVLDFVTKWEVATLGFLKAHAKKTEGLAINTVGAIAEQLVEERKIYQHLIKIAGKAGPPETVFSTLPNIMDAQIELNARLKKSKKQDSHDSHGESFV